MITPEKRIIAITRIGVAMEIDKEKATEIIDALIDLFKEERRQIILSSEEIDACQKAWLGTLEYFGIERPILPHENMKIASMINQYGYKTVAYALTGMRYEERTNSFDPKKNVSLTRMMGDEKLLEKFVNLAAQKVTEQKKRENANKPPIQEPPNT